MCRFISAIRRVLGGAVHLTLAQREDAGRTVTEFRVKDTGVGIREADQQHLLESAGFVDGAGAFQLRPGAGLGFHLSQKLAGLIGGEITVESVYGTGSTFTLTL